MEFGFWVRDLEFEIDERPRSREFRVSGLDFGSRVISRCCWEGAAVVSGSCSFVRGTAPEHPIGAERTLPGPQQYVE